MTAQKLERLPRRPWRGAMDEEVRSELMRIEFLCLTRTGFGKAHETSERTSEFAVFSRGFC
ncbi:hypothetical protein ASF79_07960 [Agreia sp. Leaf335]|nr:hypothetical protein ASF79_07960 [Agreia sp. Leaf335]